jgi:hypothetical protein
LFPSVAFHVILPLIISARVWCWINAIVLVQNQIIQIWGSMACVFLRL